MKIWCPFGPSLGLLFKGIKRNATGQRVNVLHLSFGLTAYASLSVWLSNIGMASNRVIARMLSVMETFHRMRWPSSPCPQVIRTLPKMNTGSLQKRSMDTAAAPAIGIKRLTLFYVPLALYPVPMTHVSTPASDSLGVIRVLAGTKNSCAHTFLVGT